jgi:hypothetical protein
MERMIRVVLFLVLAVLGLDHTTVRRRLDALQPPHRTALHELLTYYTAVPGAPQPPPPLEALGGAP